MRVYVSHGDARRVSLSTLYSPSRPLRGNQAVLPTPQVRRLIHHARMATRAANRLRYAVRIKQARAYADAYLVKTHRRRVSQYSEDA
jgi:hypothetical protein